MNLYTSILIYYIIGLEYAYQTYKDLDRLESIHGWEQIYSVVVLPFLWLPHKLARIFKRREKKVYKAYKITKTRRMEYFNYQRKKVAI